jgi:hypothetical protein
VQLPASTEPPLGVQSNAAAALAPSGSAERPLVSSAGRRGPSVRVILYECLITAARGYPTNVEPLARSTAPGLDVSSLGSELAARERAGGRAAPWRGGAVWQRTGGRGVCGTLRDSHCHHSHCHHRWQVRSGSGCGQLRSLQRVPRGSPRRRMMHPDARPRGIAIAPEEPDDRARHGARGT